MISDRVGAEGDGKDDTGADQRTDDQGQPPLPAVGIASHLDGTCAREHQSEKDENRHGTCIDEDLHNSYKFGIEQQIDARSHCKDNDQRKRAVHNIALSHYKQRRPYQDNGDNPEDEGG